MKFPGSNTIQEVEGKLDNIKPKFYLPPVLQFYCIAALYVTDKN